MAIEARLILNDIHIPAHDPAALDIALSVGSTLHQKNCLKEIILNGDILDFFNVKFHPVSPHDFGITTTIKDEIYLGNKFLDHLAARFPGTEITLLAGNHEDRLSRFLAQKAPDIFDLIAMPALLKLDERGIEYVPYGRHQLYRIAGTDLFCRHSPYSYAIHCAYNCITKKFINLIFGCTHRYQEIKLKDGEGKEKYACSNACLIDFEHPIFNYMSTDNWAKGFSVIYTDGGWWQNTHVKIKDGRTVFDGHEYHGSKDFDFTVGC